MIQNLHETLFVLFSVSVKKCNLPREKAITIYKLHHNLCSCCKISIYDIYEAQIGLQKHMGEGPGVNTLAGAATNCFATMTPAVIHTARRNALSRSVPVPSDITATCVNFDGLAWQSSPKPKTPLAFLFHTTTTCNKWPF